jgi:[ribosomal protein S18]-alanine N-acetyltransferase
MIANCEIRLAVTDDARAIATMSRDLVEHGLGWRWTPAKVIGCIRDRTTNVAVAFERGDLVGFGIMKYADQEAHLNLLAVMPVSRHRGIGSALVTWLESCALTAGISTIYLEARATNALARGFYNKLGYKEIALARGYYWGQEDAVRIAKDLWQ